MTPSSIAVGPFPLQTRSAAPVWLAFTPGVFVFLWATGFIGARLTAGEAEPFSFLFVRCVLVASILAVAALLAGAPWPSRRAAGHALVVGALIHGAYLGLVFWSITHGLPAGVAALIVGLQPLLTALLAAPLLGERITARHWLGLAVGLLGIALVVLPKLTFTAQGITPATVAGAVAATLSIAIGSIYIRTIKDEFGGLYEAIAASYNAGEDNAARWLNRTKPKEPGIFASEVGFAETKNYVYKVMNNYRVYRELYDKNLNRR